MLNVLVISLMAFLTPFCSSIYAPGLLQVEAEFETTATVASLSVSIFVIAFGIGPLVLAPLSETVGRKYIYQVCYVIFTLFQIGCALSTSIGMLIGFRLLAGLFGSAGIALGGGTISGESSQTFPGVFLSFMEVLGKKADSLDMFNPRERAKVVGKYVLGILIGPVIGPIAGGFITEKLGWRWCFWIMTCVSGINSLVGLLFLRESYAPQLLTLRARRMAAELRHPTIAADHDPRSLERRLWQAVKRPMKILFLQPIVFIMACYMALLYGCLYLLFTTFPEVWSVRYGFTAGEAGLTYIGLGVGFITAVLVGIPQIDRLYNRLADRRNGGVGKPEYRIPIANVGAVCVPLGLFMYGWAVERRDFWFVPILGTSFFGLGMILIFNAIQNYYIDAFTRYAASAIAAGSVFRAIVGAVFPLFAPYLYRALGYGWGTSVLGFVAVLLMPMPLVIMKYGERIRQRFVLNLD